MAKIKLGQTPKNFKRVVTFPMIDGTTGRIEMNYIYRTRTEFGKFIDELMDKAGATATSDKPTMAELMEQTAGSNAEYVLKVATGWDLEDDFSLANLQQLSDEVPAAVNAIMETYRTAITEGRLGN